MTDEEISAIPIHTNQYPADTPRNMPAAAADDVDTRSPPTYDLVRDNDRGTVVT
jgi:hypothetical protein